MKEEYFTLVSAENVFESPLNPRKTFNPKKMKELVESIRVKGILVPLLVRPRKEGPGFEIASGHRRIRGALEAGLTKVPCHVREMDDRDFLDILIIENDKHEALEPLEQAQGYMTLMKESGYDIPGIALKISKSESYVYQRLKLLELIPEAQKKLIEDKITAGHAILIARLQPSQQKEVLKACFRWGGECKSVRELTDWINRNIHLDLNSASFPKNDANFLPEAGPCTTCPKRTGFIPMLFPDVQKKDTCTDPNCFRSKVSLFIERWIKEKSQDTDHPPLRISSVWNGRIKKLPEDPKQPIPRDLYHYIEGKKDRCESVREGIVVDGEDQGQVKQFCVDPKCKKHHARLPDPGMARYRTQQKAQQEKNKHEKAIRAKILDETMKKISDLSKEDLTFITEQFFDELWDEYRKDILTRHDLKAIKGQYTSDQHTPMKKYVEKCSKGDLYKLLMEMALIRNVTHSDHYGRKKEDHLLAVAKRYGVDPKKIEAEFRVQAKRRNLL